MRRKAKIFLILISLTLILSFYTVFSLKRVKIVNENNQAKINFDYKENQVEKISKEQIKENYKTSIKKLWFDYEETLIEVKDLDLQDDFSTSSKDKLTVKAEYDNKISELKIEALSFVVPEQYRDMHLKMVMSLSSLKNYLNSSAGEHKEQALSLYMEAKNELEHL